MPDNWRAARSRRSEMENDAGDSVRWSLEDAGFSTDSSSTGQFAIQIRPFANSKAAQSADSCVGCPPSRSPFSEPA